jgi:iron complex transport system ATP-binding protein
VTAIHVEHLKVRLRQRTVLDDVSFDIAAPGLVVIIGANGAGKSTLLRALAGLVPAHHGTIRIGGGLLHAMTPQQRARAIGYLPQERTVHWPLPARQIVALGRLPHQPPGAGLNAVDQAAIDTALSAMDATALADRPVLELSGGERARILIARVLAQEPAIILADEPTAGLDPKHQWALFERLEAAAARGTRIIVALHDLALASRFARHVLLVAEGRLAAAGTPDDVLTAERLVTVFGVASGTIEHDGRRLIVPLGLSDRAD